MNENLPFLMLTLFACGATLAIIGASIDLLGKYKAYSRALMIVGLLVAYPALWFLGMCLHEFSHKLVFGG